MEKLNDAGSNPALGTKFLKQVNMNNLTVLIYYIYIVVICSLTGYVVFILNESVWWFIPAFLLIQISPNSKK